MNKMHQICRICIALPTSSWAWRLTQQGWMRLDEAESAEGLRSGGLVAWCRPVLLCFGSSDRALIGADLTNYLLC